MVEQCIELDNGELAVSIDDVQRVLELGRILLSVLTPEELEQLQKLLVDEAMGKEKVTLVSLDGKSSSS